MPETIKTIVSKQAFERAREVMPGGVNSPVRNFGSINGNPLFIKKARGSTLYDVDDNSFTDYCLSWGVFIQGHASGKVSTRVAEALANGTSFGAPTLAETELALKIVSHFNSVEQVRLVNSGTEAVMSAIRLARAFTGREFIVKFDGCYHGHSDPLLVKAGSGVTGIPNASSAGVPEAVVARTLSIPFNQPEDLQKIFTRYGSHIAAVIVEPVPANMGLILPLPGYLKQMEELCRQHGSLLIFDEIITGYRIKAGGVQSEFSIRPDITCLGKIIGGGFPIGVYGARKEIMKMVAPIGPVYQAGTLAGNPVAVAAGLAVLEILEEPDFYTDLNQNAEWFGRELEGMPKKSGLQIHRFHSMFSFFFAGHAIRNFDDVLKTDRDKFRSFYLKLLAHGIYLSPSPVETNFISMAHTKAELTRTLEVIERSLIQLKF